MSKLEIIKYGDKLLREKNSDVKDINDEIKNLASDMLETMYGAPGVGLAAPQVGIKIRMCVVDISAKQDAPLVLINPKIIKGENKIAMEEGCLSFPGIYESVKRFEKITVEFLDLNARKQEVEFNGFIAKAIAHEIDHLDAKLFIDYLPIWKRKALEKEIKRRKKAGTW
jgi:peptide deformylase